MSFETVFLFLLRLKAMEIKSREIALGVKFGRYSFCVLSKYCTARLGFNPFLNAIINLLTTRRQFKFVEIRHLFAIPMHEI